MGTTMAWSSFVKLLPHPDAGCVQTYRSNWTGRTAGNRDLSRAGLPESRSVRIVPKVSGNRRRNILQAIGITMATTYLAMTLTDSIPLLIVITLVSGLAQGYWPDPQLDTVLPALA